VIDTVGQKVGPLSMIDRYATPFGPAMHVIERYRLIDGVLARDFQRKQEPKDCLDIQAASMMWSAIMRASSSW